MKISLVFSTIDRHIDLPIICLIFHCSYSLLGIVLRMKFSFFEHILQCAYVTKGNLKVKSGSSIRTNYSHSHLYSFFFYIFLLFSVCPFILLLLLFFSSVPQKTSTCCLFFSKYSFQKLNVHHSAVDKQLSTSSSKRIFNGQHLVC